MSIYLSESSQIAIEQLDIGAEQVVLPQLVFTFCIYGIQMIQLIFTDCGIRSSSYVTHLDLKICSRVWRIGGGVGS